MGYGIGDKFGSLEIVGFYEEKSKSGRLRRMVSCVCDCGKQHNCEKYNLGTGNTRHCGDCSSLKKAKHKTTHRHSASSTEKGSLEAKCYYTWQGIKRRTLTTYDAAYRRYGGRGIGVCDEWANSYEAFLSDMGLPPTMEHQIDRTDNNGNYEPSNCLWVTRKQNANNKSNNRAVTAFGKTQNLAEWAREVGIKRETIARRLNAGATPEDALNKKMKRPGKIRSVDTPSGTFETISEAARAHGMSVSGMFSRLGSDKYPEFRYHSEAEHST